MRGEREKGEYQQGEAILKALRNNMKLLGELAVRYEVNLQGEQPRHMPQIQCPQDVHDLLAPEMSPLAQEQLRVLLLNIQNRVMGQTVVYQGNVSSSEVRAAEVFRQAVLDSAPRIIISHNHPSQDPTPSPEDRAITRELVDAGKLLGIELLDHVIIGGKKFASLKGDGTIP